MATSARLADITAPITSEPTRAAFAELSTGIVGTLRFLHAAIAFSARARGRAHIAVGRNRTSGRSRTSRRRASGDRRTVTPADKPIQHRARRPDGAVASSARTAPRCPRPTPRSWTETSRSSAAEAVPSTIRLYQAMTLRDGLSRPRGTWPRHPQSRGEVRDVAVLSEHAGRDTRATGSGRGMKSGMAVGASVVVFDVNQTLSDLAPMARRFADVGAPEHLAKLWFATLLRDGFALTAAGAQQPFSVLGDGALRAVLAGVGLNRGLDAAAEYVMRGFAALPVHADVADGIPHPARDRPAPGHSQQRVRARRRTPVGGRRDTWGLRRAAVCGGCRGVEACPGRLPIRRLCLRL